MRMSRKIGRIRPIHVRCVSQTVGNSASDPSKSRQSTNARITRLPEQLNDRPPGVVEHGENQVGNAAGVFAQDRRNAAGFQFIDAMQRQSHGMVEHLFPHRHLHALGHARGLPAAPEADHLRNHRHPHHRHRHDGQQVPAIVSADESNAARRDGIGCSRSTLSNTIFVPYSGTRPSDVETARVINAPMSSPPMPAQQFPELPEQKHEGSRSRLVLFAGIISAVRRRDGRIAARRLARGGVLQLAAVILVPASARPN